MLPRSSFFILSSSLLLLLAACEDTLQNSLPATGDGLPVTLTLDSREESAATRTGLESADPTHHVEQVEILIFEGGGDDAQCIDTETIKTWPKEQNSFTYTLQHPFVEGRTYTLLGVGKDDKFSDTYEIEQNNTLRQTYAKLKDGKSKDDIATCEFFTGTVTFTHQGRSTQIDDLTMRRRVAGVMLYVTEIPQEVDGKRVTSVRLELGSDQKSSVLLKRDFTNLEWTEPDGQEVLTDSKTLAQIDLLKYTYDGQDFYMEENGKPATEYAGVYMLPLNKTEKVNTFTVKLYGKEVDGEGNPTGTEEPVKSFTVTNHNANSTTFDIRSNYIYCIGKRGEGINEPISLSGKPIYLDVTEWTTINTNNPTFESARVQALFDDTDNPIYDCINQTFKVKILPPLSTIRDRVSEIILTVSGTTYALNEAGENIKITEDSFENDNDDLSKDEKLALYDNWLYIKQEDYNTSDEDATYGKSLNLTGQLTQTDATGIDVTFFITDYARPRRNWGWKYENLASGEYSWQPANANIIQHIDNDMRTMDIILETKFKDGTNTRTDVMTIRQYNTITVCYNPNNGDNQWANCGFRRKDVYDENGRVRAAWRFNISGSTNNSVYGGNSNQYNGWDNLSKVGYQALYNTDDNWRNAWNESAMQKAQTLFRKIGDNGKITTHINPGNNDAPKSARNSGECWYLPARYEMEGLIIMVSSTMNGQLKNHEEFYITTTENQQNEVMAWYWTSTLPNASTTINTDFDAYACRYLKTSNGERVDTWDGYARSQTGLIRQARRFPDQLKKGY